MMSFGISQVGAKGASMTPSLSFDLIFGPVSSARGETLSRGRASEKVEGLSLNIDYF